MFESFFPNGFSLGHVRYSFEKATITFPLKVQKTEKTKMFFGVKFPSFPPHMWIAVLTHLENFCRKTKRSLQLQNWYKNQNFSGQRNDPLKAFLWTRGWQLWQPWGKTFRVKVLLFLLKVWKRVKYCPKLQTMFFFKVFQGYVGYTINNPGKIFRQSEKSVRSKSWKVSKFFFFEKRFSSPVSFGNLFQFWQPWKNFSSLSRKLHCSSEKPETINNFPQKHCSVSIPVDT